ncbi:hypothetical protein JCM24511_02755 [Saitozyma sp. JCM 24511]|nr:hypothetical protein JCM24511_02755 [Saitozyma sp. JCM 24511]
MFRPVLPTLRAAANQHRTMYSKATIVGRLGAAPAAKEGANGKSYYIYSLASSKPPRRNANGEIILGEDGRPVRDTNWFSIFNFAENAAPGMDRLQAGDLVMVEASLDTRALGGAEGEPVRKEIVLREINHRILDRPPAKA